MTFIAKPKIAHPSLPRNPLGMTRRDYEGALSTPVSYTHLDVYKRQDEA